jgi:sensor histidine kinase YesM
MERDYKFGWRAWLIYLVAWVPFALSYFGTFLFPGNLNFEEIISAMFFNIVPAMILGVAIVYLCLKIPSSNYRKFWFFPLHILMAITFSLAWYAVVSLISSLRISLTTGVWAFNLFRAFALQWQIFSGLLIYGTMVSIIYAWQFAQNLRAEEKRAAQIEILYSQAQLASLRSQLNPHFLFNTLHSLMALVRYQPNTAENAIEKLSEMLRYVLPEKSSAKEANALVTFRDEWNFTENYLELEKLRLGNRLTIEKNIAPETLDFVLPAFTLQPLVENAVKHGIAPRAEAGKLTISAKKDGDFLHLEVSDNGNGANAENLADAEGLGLRLVRQQLEIHYGTALDFSIETMPNKGFTVNIKLPIMAIKPQK